MVDKELIKKLLSNLNFYLSELKKKRSISLQRFLSDYDIQAVVERRMQECIEVCIDIGNHIISDENFRPAKTYREVFFILEENKIISQDLAKNLADLASFRNILVHGYTDLDSKIVYQKFKSSINVFEKFIKNILEFIK